MVETIFDTLNAKAALYAIGEFLECSGLDIPSKCVDGFNLFFPLFCADVVVITFLSFVVSLMAMFLLSLCVWYSG